MNKLEIKTFFTALLKMLIQTDGNRVEDWFVKEYHKNLDKLGKILNYDFKNFKLELPPEQLLVASDYQGTDASMPGAGGEENRERIEMYNRDELILKLNHVLLMIEELNKKI